ncbi:MAG: hypothetical protein JSS69_11580 [Acidobacteria bacterium]|nr:hypothetical protein [Acidobacteriota bacterium]MBS1866544.1 hypothetical protein [Acidobacteriota bacterium]
MKSFVFRAIPVLMFLGLVTCGPTMAQGNDNDGCSNATLKGDYAFTVSGQIFIPNGPTIQREGIAMTHFDGDGGLTQVDFVLSSPNAAPPPGKAPTDTTTGFHTDETGTYTVNRDCTGNFTINFPPFVTSSGATVPGAIISVQFVLSNDGKAIHSIVSSLKLPGGLGPVPALIRSEGHKLGRVGKG